MNPLSFESWSPGQMKPRGWRVAASMPLKMPTFWPWEHRTPKNSQSWGGGATQLGRKGERVFLLPRLEEHDPKTFAY